MNFIVHVKNRDIEGHTYHDTLVTTVLLYEQWVIYYKFICLYKDKLTVAKSWIVSFSIYLSYMYSEWSKFTKT